MNTFDLIEKTADINSNLLEEAATLKRKPHKGLKIAAVLCCIIVALGATAYAMDMFGIRFPDTPKEGTMTIKSKEDGSREYKRYTLEALVPAVDRQLIKGNVQNDLARIDEYINSNHVDPDPCVVTGLSPEQAADYIGYEYLEPVWYPYDDGITVLCTENNHISVDAINENCGTKDNWLMVNSGVSFVIGDPESSGYRGFSWTEKDNHYTVTSRNGCECHIVEYSFVTGGEAPFNKISGITIKNGLIYNFDAIFSENNRAEAERIVRAWAEHF